MFSRVGEIHNSGSNFQSTAANKVSAARSVHPDGNESYFRDLSHKDRKFDQDMVKYSFEYNANELFEDQQERVNKDKIERSFGSFARS